MIGRGELRGAGGGGDVKSILNTCFFISSAFKGIFVLKRSLKKKQNQKKNGQVLNKPQMRLLLKISECTFYEI